VQVPANRASKRPCTASGTDKTPDETLTDGEMEDDQGAGQEGSERCDDCERDRRNAVGKQAQVFSNGAGGSGSSAMQRSFMASRIGDRERGIEDHHHVSLDPSSQQPSPASSTGPAKDAPASRQDLLSRLYQPSLKSQLILEETNLARSILLSSCEQPFPLRWP
jgi:hypothetical protein